MQEHFFLVYFLMTGFSIEAGEKKNKKKNLWTEKLSGRKIREIKLSLCVWFSSFLSLHMPTFLGIPWLYLANVDLLIIAGQY